MKFKRILIPLLAIMMVCLVAAAPLSAAEATPASKLELDFVVACDSAVENDPLLVENGDIITVTASVVANPGMNSAQFTLVYDTAALEVVKEEGVLSYTSYGDVFSLESGATVAWEEVEGELYWIYMGDNITELSGKLVQFSFKVKEGYHGDIRFDLKEGSLVALNGVDVLDAEATFGNAGVHQFAGAPSVVETTCTQDGSKTYHCNTCNQDIVVPTEEATGHNLTAHGAVSVTCEADGSLAYWHCDRCQGYFLDAEATQATTAEGIVIKTEGHKKETTPGKPATCTETGLTDRIHCTVCQTEFQAQEVIQVVDHTRETTPGKAPTCGAPGLTDRIVCTVCQTELQAQEEIPATGDHTIVIDPAVAPSDGNPGKTEGKHCSTCGTILIPQDIVEPTSLTWLWVLIVIVVVAAAGVVAYFFIFKKKVRRY